MTKRYFWLALGHVAMLLGIIGAFLPVMPTAPFVILASFAYSKGSPRFEKWLLEHPRLGPPVRAWREHGVIKRTPKVLATVGVSISVTVTCVVTNLPLIAKLVLVAVCTCVMIFVWTRPEEAKS
jgi:uncharacterized membrane protein YbaN (DUF454 family)